MAKTIPNPMISMIYSFFGTYGVEHSASDPIVKLLSFSRQLKEIENHAGALFLSYTRCQVLPVFVSTIYDSMPKYPPMWSMTYRALAGYVIAGVVGLSAMAIELAKSTAIAIAEAFLLKVVWNFVIEKFPVSLMGNLGGHPETGKNDERMPAMPKLWLSTDCMSIGLNA